MIAYPQPDEYKSFFGGYIQRVSENTDIIALLTSQPDELRSLLQNTTEEEANSRPAVGEWSIKEIIGHINDTERIFAYRALRIARGDTTPLPGFEQNDYVTATDFNARSLSDLLDEFTFQRRANVLCFKPLTAEETARRGVASDAPISARALLFVMAGHVMHHIFSLQTDYKVIS